jgi:hypothetical protein
MWFVGIKRSDFNSDEASLADIIRTVGQGQLFVVFFWLSIIS